ncbi:MAG: hypothetical protein AAGE52_30405 [Myxococcota bacterium]
MTCKPPIPGRCRSCGALIYWAQLTTGRVAPIDATPSPDGNVVLTYNRKTGKIQGHVLRAEDHVAEDRHRYKSHFATCGYAKAWRRS